MRFEPVKQGRKDNKVNKLIEQFLNCKYEKVEVFNENDFESNARMVAALRFAVKSYYTDQVEVKRVSDRIFLIKKEKGAIKPLSITN